MSNNYQQDGQRRVRNVPIRLESDRPDQYRYVNNQDQSRTDNQADFSFPHRQSTSPNSHNHYHQYAGVYSDQSTPSHTSSININYKTPSPSQASQSGRQRSGNNSPSQSNNSSRANTRIDNTEVNGESSKSSVDRNRSPQSGDSAMKFNSSDCDTPEPGPKEPDAIIPLPPPPEQPKSENQHTGAHNSQEQDQGKNQSKNDANKQEPGPQGVINSTKAEVNRLLQEIAKCNETSLTSREYIRLDEQLTVCILKLDDIQSPELRQQRKDVINLINKCIELLERKINLNFDIKQLSANSS